LRSTFHTPISKTLKESIDSKKRAEKMKRIFERKKEDKILSSSNVLKEKKNFYDDDDGFVFHYVRILSRARLWNTFFSFLFFSFLFFQTRGQTRR
tara:strand:- start:327 stop:611 length:285 start_codon:yes stop_codon:yes gene_type:complete